MSDLYSTNDGSINFLVFAFQDIYREFPTATKLMKQNHSIQFRVKVKFSNSVDNVSTPCTYHIPLLNKDEPPYLLHCILQGGKM